MAKSPRPRIGRAARHPTSTGNFFRSVKRFPATGHSFRAPFLECLEELESRTVPSIAPVGSEFQANTFVTGAQETASPPQPYAPQKAAAINPTQGNFIVTWSSQNQDGSGWGVYAQRYNASGSRDGGEFRVNTYTTSDQNNPAVAMDSAGNFVIAWASDGEDGSGWGVYAQRFNAAGIAQGGEFRVNTYTPSDQLNPSVAMDSAGDFVVTWSSDGENGNGWGVYGQRYNALGVAQGGEFQVNTYTLGDQEYPSVAMDPAGDFVVTWSSVGQDGSGWGVYAQRYSPLGVAQGGEFQVNTYTKNDQEFSSVALDSVGDFVVTWSSHTQDGNGWGVYAQRYNALGVAQGAEFQVNTYTNGDQEFSSVGMDSTGNFLIVWASRGEDGSGWGIYGQDYDSLGVAHGGEFRVNTYTQSDQNWPSLAMDASGEAVAVWSSNNEDGNSWGVFGQQYTEPIGIDFAIAASGTTVNATEGNSFTGVVASFSDADPLGTASQYTTMITWGDGNGSAGTITANGSGGFNVTGTNIYAEAGNYSITVTIDDVEGASATANSAATVADEPLTAAGVPVSAVEGNGLSGVVAAFTDGNPQATSSDFSATVTWGDGQSSTGTVTATGSGGFQVSAATTYAETGSYTVSVQINDNDGSQAAASAAATVADATLHAGGSTVAPVAGTPFSGVLATFTDDNPLGSVSDFTAVIDWGDGTTTNGSVTAAAGGGFDVNGTHAYTGTNSYAYSVVITDVDGSRATAGGTANVAGAAIVSSGAPISATEGIAFNGGVASFTDSNSAAVASDFTVTIAWGDGVTSSGTVAANGGGFAITGSHTYWDEGSRAVRVTINSASGNGAAATTATVADTPLTATGDSFQIMEGSVFNGVVATFTDPGSNGSTSPYTATIDWGDGHVSAGTVILSGGVYSVSGTNQYAQAGSYSVWVSIDAGGSTASARPIDTVTDAALVAIGQSLSELEGASYSGPVATFTDGNGSATAGDFTASIFWGDGQSSTGTITKTGGRFTVSGSNTYAEAGSYAVQVSVQDIGANTASTTGTATISDAALRGTGRSFAAVEGSAFRGTVATFGDSNPLAGPGDFTARIDWGDGHTSFGTVAGSAGNFDVSGSNVYAEAGSYAVQVVIQDVEGGSTSANATAALSDAALSARGRSFTAVEGSAYSGVLATFADANPLSTASDFQASIVWGDGHTGGAAISKTSGVFEVLGQNAYTEAGSDAFTAVIRDRDGTVAAVQGTVPVAEAALSGAGESISLPGGHSFDGAVAGFIDANPYSAAQDFDAVIGWGDGTTTMGTVTADGHGGFEVIGSHAYLPGQYALQIDVLDIGGASLHLSGAVRAAGILIPPAAGLVTTNAGGQASFSVALSSQPDADVIIPIASTNPAVADSAQGSLTFTPANWNVSQTVIVTGPDSARVRGDIAYEIVLGPVQSADASYNGLQPGPVNGVTDDVDRAAIVVIPVGGLTTTDQGSSASFNVVLASQPRGGVEIDLLSTAPDEGWLSTTRLLFTPSTWDVPQTVGITGLKGSNTSAETAYRIVMDPAISSDPFYQGLHAPDVGVINVHERVVASIWSPDSTLPGLDVTAVTASAPTPGTASNGSSAVAVTAVPDFSLKPTSPGYHWFAPQELAAEEPPPKNAAAANRSSAAPPSVVVAPAPRAATTQTAVPLPAVSVKMPPAPPSQPVPGPVRAALPLPFAQQQALDDFRINGFQGRPISAKVGNVVITGVVASVGYVLLSSRGSLWILSVLTARPLVWRRFDPVDMLFAWEEEKKRRQRQRETLQSIVQ